MTILAGCAKAAGIRVGSHVQVVKQVGHESGWENSWSTQMDDLIGDTGLVSSISSLGVDVKTSRATRTFAFPVSSLCLYSDGKVPEDSDEVRRRLFIKVIRNIQVDKPQ